MMTSRPPSAPSRRPWPADSPTFTLSGGERRMRAFRRRYRLPGTGARAAALDERERKAARKQKLKEKQRERKPKKAGKRLQNHALTTDASDDVGLDAFSACARVIAHRGRAQGQAPGRAQPPCSRRSDHSPFAFDAKMTASAGCWTATASLAWTRQRRVQEDSGHGAPSSRSSRNDGGPSGTTPRRKPPRRRSATPRTTRRPSEIWRRLCGRSSRSGSRRSGGSSGRISTFERLLHHVSGAASSSARRQRDASR